MFIVASTTPSPMPSSASAPNNCGRASAAPVPATARATVSPRPAAPARCPAGPRAPASTLPSTGDHRHDQQHQGQFTVGEAEPVLEHVGLRQQCGEAESLDEEAHRHGHPGPPRPRCRLVCPLIHALQHVGQGRPIK